VSGHADLSTPTHILLDCRMATWTGIGRYSTGLARHLAAREELQLTLVTAAGEQPPTPPTADGRVPRA